MYALASQVAQLYHIRGGDLRMKQLKTLEKLEACSTLDELSKLADLDTLKRALRSYLKSKVYHAKHNARNAEMIRAYKAEHPEA